MYHPPSDMKATWGVQNYYGCRYGLYEDWWLHTVQDDKTRKWTASAWQTYLGGTTNHVKKDGFETEKEAMTWCENYVDTRPTTIKPLAHIRTEGGKVVVVLAGGESIPCPNRSSVLAAVEQCIDDLFTTKQPGG